MTAGVPYTFTPGQTPIDANQVNADFAALVNYINGLSIPTTPVSIANGGTGSTTPAAALTALGLAQGTIIPGTVTYSASGSNGTLTFTGAASAPTVSAYALGNFYAFQVPSTATPTELFFVDATTSGSGLAALQVYSNPGFSAVTSLTSDQFCVLAFEPIADTFVLLNPPALATSNRFQIFTNSGTLTVPAGVTQMWATGCGGGAGGGASNGTGHSGGGGGGGAAAVVGPPFTVTPAHLLAITIGAYGAGGSGAAGSNGGTTTLVDSSTATTITVLAGGNGGAEGTTSSNTTGGTAGGSGGIAGSTGHLQLSGDGEGGAGGACLLGAGAPGVSGALGGNTAGQFGGGGGGGGSGSAGGSSGGNGAPGFMRLEW